MSHPGVIEAQIAEIKKQFINAPAGCGPWPHRDPRYLVLDLEIQISFLREMVTAARRLAYEIEGGDRWPVVWEDDMEIMPALKAFKDLSPLPEWERDGPGFKRKPL